MIKMGAKQSIESPLKHNRNDYRDQKEQGKDQLPYIATQHFDTNRTLFFFLADIIVFMSLHVFARTRSLEHVTLIPFLVLSVCSLVIWLTNAFLWQVKIL